VAATLPMAVAIAASPFPVIPAVLLLLTARPRSNAGGFLLGWAVGVTLWVVGALLLADLLVAVDSPPTWASWARIAVGAALVGYAVRQWTRRSPDAGLPAWMQTIQDTTPRRAVRLGLVLSAANPKIILLAGAGGLSIGAEVVGAGLQAGAVVLFAAVASTTVAAPLLCFLAAGERALAPLRRASGWLERNHGAVMAVVLLVIGALLLTKGVQGL